VRRLVQLRHATSLTSEAYLAEHAWVKASLATCPRHPGGGCGLARHGTYPRKTPTGMRVTRYYCPTAHETFSLLPDCLASRFPSDLDDLERVAVHVAAARSVEAAADTLRPDIELPSAVRWIRRRLTVVRTALVLAAGLLPDLRLSDASLGPLGSAWGTARVLVTLRSRVADHLAVVPPPLGFGPRPIRRPIRRPASQHAMGADRAGPSG
jgi:hypothetical protein